MKEKVIVKAISELMLDKKGLDIQIIDVQGLTSITDYFVNCSSQSDPQTRAIKNHIQDSLFEKYQIKPLHIEGYENLNWVLLDYFDVVVHVFRKDDRDYYNIEKLWADAPITEFIDEEAETTDH